MKNKKGFTLIEVLGVVIILAILLLISMPQVVKYINKGKVNYYVSLENEMNVAGANYMEDYRALLPRQVGHVRVVTLENLVENKYIDEVKDEDGNVCTGKVVIKKAKKDSYEYYSCLICGEDGKYYESSTGACNMQESGNEYADSEDYEIRTKTGLYEFETDQFSTYTSLDPKVQVLYKGNVIVGKNDNDYLEGEPNVLDTKEVGLKQIVYYYHGVTKIVKVNVLDKTKPAVPSVTLKYISEDEKVNNKIYKNEWYSGNILATFKSTDYSGKGLDGTGIDYYEVSANGTTGWQKIDGNNEILSTEGEYTRYVRAVDKSGNISEVASYSVKIDKTAPTCAWSGYSTDWIKEGSRTITTTCSDTISGCTNDTKVKQWTYTNSIKTDNLSFTMYDLAGNAFECADPAVNIYIDKEKPTIRSLANPLYLNDTQSYTFTTNLDTSDSYSGIKKVECDPEVTSKICSYDVTCNIEDIAGNTNSVTFRTQHYYDRIAITSTCSTTEEYCTERADECNCCSWAWDDGCSTWGGGVCAPSQTCMRDGGGDHCCSHDTRTVTYSCTKYACDSRKPANLVGSRCIYNCGLLCKESIEAQSTGLVASRKVKLKSDHTNGADLQYRIEVTGDETQNREWQSVSNNALVELKNDATEENPIIVHLKDFSTSCEEVTYTETSIDATPPTKPVVTIKEGNDAGDAYDNSWYSGNIYASFEATDSYSGIDHYEVSSDKKAWPPIDGNSILIEKSDNNTWYVRAVDKVGNIGEYQEFTTKIDKEKPAKPVVTLKKESANGSAYDGSWYSGKVHASFTVTPPVSGIDHYEFSSNGTTWQTLSSNYKLINTNDEKTWYVRAVSGSGNASDPETFTTKIDTSKPTVSLGNLEIVPGLITIPYSASDTYSGLKSVTCVYGKDENYGSTATNSNGKFSFPTDIRETYYYKITAIDNANNTLVIEESTLSGGFNDIHITGDPDISRWAPSRTITISGETPSAVLQYKIAYTSTPEKNKDWTTIDSGYQITIDETTTIDNPVYITARFKAGDQTSDEISYTETQIDTTKPFVNSGQPVATSNSTIIPLVVSDPESGIEKTVCKYGTTENGFNVASVETTTDTCTFNNLSKNSKYYYKIITYNRAGLTRIMYLFEYTEDEQKFNTEVDGQWKIEAYGGGGVNTPNEEPVDTNSSTKGSYATGTTILTSSDTLYVYVGGRETLFNGGGQGGSDTHMNNDICNHTVDNVKTTNGSGATDIRLAKSTASDKWSGNNSLVTRLVTAGGGGGAKKNTGRAFADDIAKNECFDSTSLVYFYGVDGELANTTLGKGSDEVFGTSEITRTGDSGWGASAGGGGGFYGGQTTAAIKSTPNYSDVFYGGHHGTRNGWVTINGNRMVGVEVHAYAGTSRVQNGYTFGNRMYTLGNIQTQTGANTGNGYAKIIEDDVNVVIPTYGVITVSADYNNDTTGILGLDTADETYAKDATITITSTDSVNPIQYRLGSDGDWTLYTRPFVVDENITVYARQTDDVYINNVVTYTVSGLYIKAADVTYNNTTVQDVFDDIYERMGE